MSKALLCLLLFSGVVLSQAPVIIIESPVQGGNYTAPLDIVFKAIDDEGVLACQLYRDGVSISTFNVNAPARARSEVTVLEGEHNLRVSCTDADENTGSDDVTFSVTTSLPDLSITPMSIAFNPESPLEGDKVKITVSLFNKGNAPATNLTLKVYDGIPENNVVIFTKKYPDLPGNRVSDVKIDWDTTGKAGFHNIVVIVDEDNTINEADEGNNRAEKHVTVLSRENQGTFTGLVVEKGTTIPVPDAIITAEGAAGTFTAKSGNDGTYLLEATAGQYDIWASAEGFASTYPVTQTIANAEAKTITFALDTSTEKCTLLLDASYLIDVGVPVQFTLIADTPGLVTFDYGDGAYAETRIPPGVLEGFEHVFQQSGRYTIEAKQFPDSGVACAADTTIVFGAVTEGLNIVGVDCIPSCTASQDYSSRHGQYYRVTKATCLGRNASQEFTCSFTVFNEYGTSKSVVLEGSPGVSFPQQAVTIGPWEAKTIPAQVTAPDTYKTTALKKVKVKSDGLVEQEIDFVMQTVEMPAAEKPIPEFPEVMLAVGFISLIGFALIQRKFL